MGSSPHLWFCACKTATLVHELLVSMGPSPHLWFLDAKQRDLHQNDKTILLPAITCGSVHVKSAFRTRITSLCGSKTSSVFFSCKTATLWPDLQVCWGSSPHLWFCACKAATLAHELLVSMGPSPHLWFLHAKQRLLVQNNKSLWVPDMSCRFVHVQQRA